MRSNTMKQSILHPVAQLEYVVPDEESGIQLHTVLRSRLNLSRRLLKRLKVEKNSITRNNHTTYQGRVLTVKDKLQVGDVIRVLIHEDENEYIQPEPLPIHIVYEDEDILVVNKQAGLVVHPTSGYPQGTLANGVLHHWKISGKMVRFRAVNRLDQQTSGLLIVARHGYAHHQLSDQMQNKRMWKQYEAFVFGIPKLQTGTIHAPIDRDKQQPYLRVVTENGYDAITHYHVLETYQGQAARVSCRLETGRTHQIRVHMRHIGCPILGDHFYATAAQVNTPLLQKAVISLYRHALHASELCFIHPMNRKPLHFIAKLPVELVELRKCLLSKSDG